MRDEGSPDWLRDALRQFFDELRLFLQTAWQFSTRPRRFGRDWATGRRHALNPLGFLATSFAVTSAITLVYDHLRGVEDEARQSLLTQVLVFAGPYAYWLLFGALEHYTLRLCGLRRPLRDAWAMALYTGGGPVAAMTLLLVLVFSSAQHNHQSSLLNAIIGVAVVVCYALFMWILGAALGGLHAQARWYHLLASNVVALVVSGFVMGLNPPGTYGLHFYWQVTRNAHGLGMHYGLRGG